MLKLKTLFASDSGQYIYVGLFVVFSILSVRMLIPLILVIALGFFLWKFYRRLLLISLILTGIILPRYILISKGTQMDSSTNITGMVTDCEADQFTLKVDNERWYIYHQSAYNPIPGDVVQLSGYTMKDGGYDLPHGFDFKDYLSGIGIKNSFYATKIEYIEHRFHINQVKIHFQTYMMEISGEETGSIIILLLFGDDTRLNESIKTSISVMGITHLFAISGMHIGLLVLMIKKIIIRMRLSQTSEEIIISLFLIFYTFLCGLSLSVLRASLLVLLIYINKSAKMPFSKLDLLTFILVLFLIINPFMIHLIAFQLSFLITFSILLSGRSLESKVEIFNYFKLSLFATAIGLPIILELNGSINLWVIPMSVFFGLFVAKIILPGMFLTILIPFLMPAYRWLVQIFIDAIIIGNSLSCAIKFNIPNAFLKTAFWTVLFFCLSKVMSKKRILLAVNSYFLIILISISINHIPNMAYIRILDVGQGDAIHLHDSRCDILVDTGTIDAYDRVIEYFEKSNIYTIDFLVITHRHDDHVGESLDIQETLKVINVVSSPNVVIKSDSQRIFPSKNMRLSCGDFNIKFIHYDDSQNEENNNSIVMIVEIYQHQWLLTGDIEKFIESQLPSEDLENIEVIKVPHHGSSTSSSSNFVNLVKPKYALISVGMHNRYGHPNNEVIKRWESVGATILRTDELGTIEFRYLNSGYQSIISNTGIKKESFHYLKRIFPFLDWVLKSLFSMI